MQNLAHPFKLGRGIAAAFTANKLKIAVHSHAHEHEMLIEG